MDATHDDGVDATRVRPAGADAAQVVQLDVDRAAADATGSHRPASAPAPQADGRGDDAMLMAAYVDGDAAAFAALYDRHHRAVFRFLLRSLQQTALAEDLLQDVWLQVVRHAPAYEPHAKFTTWLFTIARNRLIDHWRAAPDVKSLDEMAAADDDGDGGGGDGPTRLDRLADERTPLPEVAVHDAAQARALMNAVSALPAPQREAFVLHLESGMTLAEIGTLTGVGTETVKSRIRYALARLRERLQEWRA
jgi:RNA polymerase sigma-70 factor (ECF subfamily)